MKKIDIVFLLAICLILTACRQTSKSSESSVPVWYYNPQIMVSEKEIAFSAMGSDQDRRQAELLSYTNLISVLENYTGSPLTQEDYKELSTKGTIESLKLSIVESSSVYSENGYKYYILAIADKGLVEESVIVQNAADSKRLETIENLILEGDAYMMANKSLDAVKCYINSLVYSYNVSNVSREYSFDEIFNEVVRILSSMELSLSTGRQKSSKTTITAQIRESTIPTRIEFCQLLCEFDSIDSRGSDYTEASILTTDGKGKLEYKPVSYSTAKNGTVTFSFNLYDEINALTKVNPEAAEKIYSIVRQGAVSFEYETNYSMGKIGIAAMNFGKNGEFDNSVYSTDFLTKRFSESGVDALGYYVADDEEDQVIIQNFKSLHNDFGCLMIVRLGLSETIHSVNAEVSIVEGSVTFYDLKKSEVIFENQVANAVGFGSDAESSLLDAYDSLSEIILNLVGAEYV